MVGNNSAHEITDQREEKLSKDIENLNNTINKLDLLDLNRILT